jgi:putative copper resistance protein D
MLPDLLSALLRGLSFIALLQAGGAALFLAMAGSDLHAARGRVMRLARLAAITAVVLLLAQYLLEPARMAGTFSGALDPTLLQFTLHTPATSALLMRCAGLALVAWSLCASVRTAIASAMLAALLIACSFTLVGHTAGHWLLASLLAVHLLAIQFWFGSLRPMVLAGRIEGARHMAIVVARFSRVALWLVPSILVAGVLMLVGLAPGLRALLDDYGAGMLGKVALFTALLALASLNKWRLTPALASGEASALRKLERNIHIEYWLIALVLVGTAFLTTFWSPEV